MKNQKRPLFRLGGRSIINNNNLPRIGKHWPKLISVHNNPRIVVIRADLAGDHLDRHADLLKKSAGFVLPGHSIAP